jgi:hypothetical protein
LKALNLITESYLEQSNRWPRSGRHILAHFDSSSVTVYQAYRPSIGLHAAKHQQFGADFSFTRMSWIKTNFLWMMYRSGWGAKKDQEVTLAVRLKREAFDWILENAVHSTFVSEVYQDRAEWEKAISTSSVRLQWDPDHDPAGAKLERRAIQLGLREDTLVKYARDWIVEIEDISDFVRDQREYANSRELYAKLLIPREDVYPITDSKTKSLLGVSNA